MYKLIIADDEKIIRETISQIIDWDALGIEIIGLCQNGIEAYNMILDEDPDIVLTDLKMPGMGGLDLIQKCGESNPDLQFIILSGFGEFEYAAQAMKYGVKHYLLKPSSEEKLKEAIEECKAELSKRRFSPIQQQNFEISNRINHNVLFSVLNDSLFREQVVLSEIISPYESYIDFRSVPYRLLYIYYLQADIRDVFLADLHALCTRLLPDTTVHGIYVENTLMLFCRNYDINFREIEEFILNWNEAATTVGLELESQSFQNLYLLLESLLPHIRRYGMIWYINNFRPICACNYKNHIDNVEVLAAELKTGDSSAILRFRENIDGINNIRFLKQLSSAMLLKLTLNNPESLSHKLTESLREIENENDLSALRRLSLKKVQEIYDYSQNSAQLSPMTGQIYNYVRDHLNDPDLTLKYISENILFMNVDYVSKKFLKETGVKFSQYLTAIRIDKAKELLLSGNNDKIQHIAESVGLGNNPQYFSQLFKKTTGMTPSAFIQSHN